MSTELLDQLRHLIRAQATGQGFLQTSLPGVVLMRMDRYLPLAPTVYEPCILIVAQGRKIGSFAGKRYVFDANNCLVLTLPLPLESETFGTPDEPFLGIAVKVAQPVVTELLVQMDSVPVLTDGSGGLPEVPLDSEVLGAAVRLAQVLSDPERASVLGPAIIREMVYLLLRAPGGGALAGLALGDGHQRRIGKIIERMHTEYAVTFSVPELARDAGMSASTFHARFKSVTGVAPLHYQKLIRLHKARDLMVNSGTTAQSAAMQVGYESASQFSREFRKVFGDSPGAVAVGLRTRLHEMQQPGLAMTLSFA
jgi:AraC-like DNA-binding protein